jgi:hypothetical protein
VATNYLAEDVFASDRNARMRDDVQRLQGNAQRDVLRKRLEEAQRIAQLQGSGRTWGDALWGSGTANSLIATGRNIGEMQEQELAKAGGGQAVLDALEGKDPMVDVIAPRGILGAPNTSDAGDLALDQMEHDARRNVLSSEMTMRNSMTKDNERARRLKQRLIDLETRQMAANLNKAPATNTSSYSPGEQRFVRGDWF